MLRSTWRGTLVYQRASATFICMCVEIFLLLVDPAVLGRLPADQLLRLEPESNLLLGVLDAVGSVAHIPAGLQGVVATNSARSRGKRVGGTEDGWRETILSALR